MLTLFPTQVLLGFFYLKYSRFLPQAALKSDRRPRYGQRSGPFSIKGRNAVSLKSDMCRFAQPHINAAYLPINGTNGPAAKRFFLN